MSKWTTIMVVTAGLMWANGAWAGSLDPTNAPGPTMHTLEEIYQELLTTQQQVADLQRRMIAAGMQTTSGNLALIPAGSFVMGATTNVGHEFSADEIPRHTVDLDAFYVDRHEVTKAEWDAVYQWATNRGYAFDSVGEGKAANHPVQMVSWHDCAKWCNARSAMDGFNPCYTNGNGTVYTNGAFAGGCDWSASGYRLPTEAEWEKVARGKIANRRFSWDDVNTIQHARANYKAEPGAYDYDTNPTAGYHPNYNSGGSPYTSPVGSFSPNGYDLFDMTGNVWEWCWDWKSSDYYASSPSTNPCGPAFGSLRTIRGGSWNDGPSSGRVAHRGGHLPSDKHNHTGFRLVRTAP